VWIPHSPKTACSCSMLLGLQGQQDVPCISCAGAVKLLTAAAFAAPSGEEPPKLPAAEAASQEVQGALWSFLGANCLWALLGLQL
jgi:hypothetical protein